MALDKGLKAKKKSKSASKKKKSSRPKHMHIEAADNGGFNVRHSYDQGGPEDAMTPDTTHAVGDENALLQHVQDHFGGQLPNPDMAGAGGGGGAAPAGGM